MENNELLQARQAELAGMLENYERLLEAQVFADEAKKNADARVESAQEQIVNAIMDIEDTFVRLRKLIQGGMSDMENNELLQARQAELAGMLENYERLLEAQVFADEAKKNADARVESAQEQIVNAIMDIEDTFGIQVVAKSGKNRYSVGRKTYYRVTAENKDAAVRSLRALGMQEIIRVTVDPRTLTKALNEVMEASRDDDGRVHLPRRYQTLISRLETYDKTTLAKRKL